MPDMHSLYSTKDWPHINIVFTRLHVLVVYRSLLVTRHNADIREAAGTLAALNSRCNVDRQLLQEHLAACAEDSRIYKTVSTTRH